MGIKEVDPCIGYERCTAFKSEYKTNADRIRAMSDEELAGQFTLIAKVAVNAFADYDLPAEICDRLWSQFLENLKQSVKDGEDE